MRWLAHTSYLGLALLPLALACRPGAPMTETTDATRYHVVGALTESACAPGLAPVDPLEFDAEARASGPILYWRVADGHWVPGSVSSDGSFRVALSIPIEVIASYPGTDPDFDPPRPGCTLIQTETIVGTFTAASSPSDASNDADAGTGTDAGSSADAGWASGGTPPDPTALGMLSADNTIELSISAGSDCRALLAEAGGPFPTLPCRVRYVLSGAAN